MSPIYRFLLENYQTEALQSWWYTLDDVWREILKEQIGCNSYEPSALELQRIKDLKELTIEQENVIQSLEPIKDCHWLEKVQVTNQGIRDIKPLANKPYLSELLVQNNPISDLSPLASDTLLSVLNYCAYGIFIFTLVRNFFDLSFFTYLFHISRGASLQVSGIHLPSRCQGRLR